MSNEQENHQALKLQQLFAEINNEHSDGHAEHKREDDTELIETDALNLPPRSEVHLQSKWKLHIHLQRPFWRLFLVLILLLGVLVGVYFIIGEQIVLLFT